MLPERFHPQYRELHAELLARPFPVVSGQVMVAYRAIVFTPGEKAAHVAAVTALATAPGVTAGPVEHGFQILRRANVELRIERHTEFTAFTILTPQTGAPFVESTSRPRRNRNDTFARQRGGMLPEFSVGLRRRIPTSAK